MTLPLILLDRDGVLNRMVVHAEHGLTDSPLHPSQVEMLPGAVAAVARLTEAGYGVAIVTNQPAAAKGKTSRENLEAVHARVVAEIEAGGGRIASSHICFHRAEDGCACRKPAAGLLRAALEAHPQRPRDGVWMVGDGVTDVQAGRLLGLRTAFLGKPSCAACGVLDATVGPADHIAPDLEGFVGHLLGGALHRSGVNAADLRVKIFADGADLDVIRRRAADPMISGFTTNPSLARKAGVTDYERFSRAALAAAGTRPVSIEVVADSPEEIAAQALRISQWAPNAYVKIPVTTTSGTSLIGVAGRLSHEGVKVNLTAILTLRHVAEAVDAFRGGAPSVISVLAGRVADAGVDPVGHMRAALAICRSADRAIELLWASPRELFNVVQASQVGVDIITVTDSLLEKLSQLGRDLGEVSLDTVRMLKADADMGGLRL